MPLAHVQSRLPELVDQVHRSDDRVHIERDGEVVAALISAADLTSMEDSIAFIAFEADAQAVAEASATGARRSASHRHQRGVIGLDLTLWLGLVDDVGATRYAEMLDIHPNRLRDLRDGAAPTPREFELATQLYAVIVMASRVFPLEATMEWLYKNNDHLEHARPIDVLRIRGSADVFDAIVAALSY